MSCASGLYRHRLPLLAFMLCSWGIILPAIGQVPGMIHYQGRVAVNGTNFDGAGQFKFALVNGTGAATYWSNGASAVSLTVNKGLFSVLLGDTNVPGMVASIPAPVFSNADVRLRVWFSPTGTVFDQLSPDQRIASMGYAMMAGTVQDGAITSGKLAAGAVQSYHLASGPADSYAQLQARLGFGAGEAVTFDSLQPVTTNGGSVSFACRVGGVNLGTVEGFIGVEHISSNYCYRVAILSDDPGMSGDSYVGQNAMLTFQRHGRVTFFDGMVSRFGLAGFDGDTARYVLEIVPHLSMLRYTTDYGIYQSRNTPDIVSLVLEQARLAPPDTSWLSGDYDPRDNVVQYGETTLDFISRLMEGEGIFYFFEHRDGPETLVLADANGAFQTVGEYIYHGDNGQPGSPAEEYVRTFGRSSALFTGTATVRDHDFTKPALDITGSANNPSGTGEFYEFGLPVPTQAKADQIAAIRLARFETERRTLAGSGNGGDLKAGGAFHLGDATGAGLGGDYVVTGVLHGGLRVVSRTNVTYYYGNEFSAIPFGELFRPAVRTPKPRATGPSSAVVVGAPGQDPYVDKYGRVRVQFHWGRSSSSSGNTSAWIRVAQPYAGPAYGITFLPGAGHEVIVDFLDGDPDRPVIVGSVHNAANVQPYPLPERKAVSTIKTKSNEIRFDDEAGSEQVYIRSGKNMDVEIANDMTTSIDNNMSVTGRNNMVVGIANDTTIDVGRDMTLSGLRRLTLSSTNEINLNAPRTTVSGGFVLNGVAPTSTASEVQYQVGELTRKTAPIAFVVVGFANTNQFNTLSSYNCRAERITPGVYNVSFRDVPANSYYAPVITPLVTSAQPLFANVIERTRDYFVFGLAYKDGSPADKPFSVVVFGGF